MPSNTSDPLTEHRQPLNSNSCVPAGNGASNRSFASRPEAGKTMSTVAVPVVTVAARNGTSPFTVET